MQFNKRCFDTFRNDVKKALAEVEKKHGVNVECGGINYGTYDFRMQLKVVKQDDNVDGRRKMFEQDCKFYGFEKTDYEREFVMNGELFMLTGFNPKSYKNNCAIVRVKDQKEFKCPASAVLNAFKKK